MSILRKFKSAFANSNQNKLEQKSDDLDAIINEIEHEPFAISDQNVLYAGLNELGGYYFLQTVIVGTFKVKIKNGGQLTIAGNNHKLNLSSDSLEFESDPTDIKGRWITKIDFQIEKSDASKIDKSQLSELHLSCKNQQLKFKISTESFKE